MKWSLLLIRAMLVAVLCFSVTVTANAQGTQIQGPRDAADVYSGVVYGPIDQSDTLWAISNQYRKNQQFTVYQVMLAIYELNPRAFVNRNFNTMVNGSMLQLPTDRYIARIDPQRARAKAEQDDRVYSQSTGRNRPSNNDAASAQSDGENLKSETPLVNKKELDAAQQQFQQQINALKRQQSNLVNEYQQQLSESIQATQAIVDDNKIVLEELARKDEEFLALRTELSESFQSKLDQQALQIQELREFVALAKMKEQESEANSFTNIIRDPLFIISATTFGFLLVFILIALVLLRKPSEVEEHAEIEGEDSENITLDDPSSNDADELLAMLENDEVSDDELLDDILSDELEESIDEIAVDKGDFDDIDDEMLVPDQNDSVDKDDLSDALLDLDDDDSDTKGLDAEFDGIDLDGDDIDLEGESDSIDLDADSDPQEVDIDSILDEQPLDVEQVGADASKELNEAESTLETDSDATPIEDDEDQAEISIDDLLEQNSLDGGLPAALASTLTDEIDEDIIEQIGAEISEKNTEINTLTNSFDEELANNNFEDDELDVDIEEDDLNSDYEDASENSDTQKSIKPLDDLTKGVEDDIADAIANAADEEARDSLEHDELDDPLSDELLSELGAEQADELDTDVEELLSEPIESSESKTKSDRDLQLEDSLNELQTETISFEQNEEAFDSLADDLVDEEIIEDVMDSGDTGAADETDVMSDADDVNADTIEGAENDELDSLDIDSILDDSLDDLLDNQVEENTLDSINDTSLNLEEPEAEPGDSIVDSEVSDEQHSELDDVSQEMLDQLDSTDSLDEIELDDFDLDDLKSLDNHDLDAQDSDSHDLDSHDPDSHDLDAQDSQSTNMDSFDAADKVDLELDDIPSLTSEDMDSDTTSVDSQGAEERTPLPEKDTLETDDQLIGSDAKESDDDLSDLPDLDDWLDDESNSESDNELAKALEQFEGSDSEDEVLREIEDADFDSLLEEMGAISDEQTAAEIDKLSIEERNEIEIDGDLGDLDSKSLDNPDLDLTALFDESADDKSKGYIDVDSLLKESENLTPATDDELELDLDMSLDSFLNDDAEIDVDLDADQASNLDLARVYIDMEDNDAAAEALEDVLQKGTKEQKEEAKALLEQLKR